LISSVYRAIVNHMYLSHIFQNGLLSCSKYCSSRSDVYCWSYFFNFQKSWKRLTTCSTLTMDPKERNDFLLTSSYFEQNLLHKGYYSTFRLGKHCGKRSDSVVVSNIQGWWGLFWKKTKQQRQCNFHGQAIERPGTLKYVAISKGKDIGCATEFEQRIFWCTEMNRSLTSLQKSCTWHYFLSLLCQQPKSITDQIYLGSYQQMFCRWIIYVLQPY